MPYPVPVVEIAFDDTPFVVNPTWTDVTSYVRNLEVDRGRTDDWSSCSGSASIVLSNRDRRFDPFNTSGPYYGKLSPRKQIRIRATYSGTTYDIFRGFVSGFPATWTDAGKDSTVTVDCFDALQLLASSQMPQDWAQSYIRFFNPTHYFPLDDPLSTFVANTGRDLGSNPQPFAIAADASNDSQLAYGLVDNSLAGDSDNFANSGVQLLAALTPTSGDFGFGVWCKASAGTYLAMENLNGYNVSVQMANWGTSTARVFVDVSKPSGQWYCYSSIQGIDWSEPFHLAFSWNNATNTPVMWINGVVRTGTVTSLGPPFIWLTSNWYATLTKGVYQQLFTYHTQLSTGFVQTVWQLSRASFQESTSVRFERLRALTSFSASLCSTPASPAGVCLDITDGAAPITPELQVIADTEGGPLYVSRAGVITMLQRNDLFTLSRCFNSQATYGASGLGLDPSVTLEFDGDEIRNEITVEMSGGGSYTADKVASQTAHGVSAQTVTTQISTYADATFMAERWVGLGQNPQISISPFKVVLDPGANWATTVGRELFDRVTVRVAPPTGNVIERDVLIRRITHKAVPGQWETTIEGSARLASYFRTNASAADGPDVTLYS